MPLEELIAKCTERVTIAEKGIKYITKNVTAVVAAYEKQQNAVQKLAKTMQVRVRERKREREREREDLPPLFERKRIVTLQCHYECNIHYLLFSKI